MHLAALLVSAWMFREADSDSRLPADLWSFEDLQISKRWIEGLPRLCVFGIGLLMMLNSEIVLC